MGFNLDQIPVVCLNLDRRADRWERVQNSPGYADFPSIKRWSAVEGKQLDITNDPRVSLLVKHNILNKTRRAHEHINTPGAIGCSLSHASVYEWLVKQSDTDVVLILEDDINLHKNCYKHIADYIRATPMIQDTSDWDIWHLGANIRSSQPIQPNSQIHKLESFYLTHAYFITKRGAERLLQHMFPIEFHLDAFHSYVASLKFVRMYATASPLLMQGGSGSDINPGHACPICDIPADFDSHSELISKARKTIYQVEDGVLKAAAVVVGLYGLWWAVSGSKVKGRRGT